MKDWKEPNNGSLIMSRIRKNNSFFSSDIFALLLVLTATIFVSFAQVMFKMVWSDLNDLSSLLGKIIFGFTLYAAGAVLFLTALRKKNVSYLFPFMTLSYAWVIFLSAYLFGEVISLGKILGVSLIFTGVFLIYAGGKASKRKVKTKDFGTRTLRIESAKMVSK